MEANERIKDLREQKSITQKQLAEKAGLNKSVMNRIESGSRPMTERELSKFADILEASADYILGRDSGVEKEAEPEVELDVGNFLEEIHTLLLTDDTVLLYGEPISEKEKKILTISLESTLKISKEL